MPHLFKPYNRRGSPRKGWVKIELTNLIPNPTPYERTEAGHGDQYPKTCSQEISRRTLETRSTTLLRWSGILYASVPKPQLKGIVENDETMMAGRWFWGAIQRRGHRAVYTAINSNSPHLFGGQTLYLCRTLIRHVRQLLNLESGRIKLF